MKRFGIVAAAAALCLLLTGCDLWMDGSYHSVEPHYQKYSGPSLESAEVTSYEELKSVLVDIISDGQAGGGEAAF